ncbi:MAG: hypothetical protein F4025_00335 [Synechococcus sp. SB0669_bin_7]|nr:DNA methyltransferase [Cyanobacteria bacterium MAG IRC3_bin_20]MDE0647203.1 DNA methyltransferase [Cyanobacteria bacterium MAG IRC4_bin_6]MYG65006.1 hypothetical protein [Synechococcus sp. SB0675_bin_7]MYK07825.1 hypothetical protein [Synechococcus sp. SB0670_bin_20]MYK84873.1 hypothetical protein [Synechococcus sp. SB0669_bin_7]
MPAANFASATIWTGDNLDIMRGMNSACVDLIYLDPPFNSNRTYEAPIGSKAAGASFKDAWTLDDVDVCEHGELADRNPAAYAVIDAARQAHGKGMQSYLVFMAVRLLEMQRILKPAGSIYLHCDPTASHYLKLLMDGIFGKDRFRNEIIWSYRTGGVSKNYFARKHDVLFYYSGGSMFNMQTEKAYTKSKNRKPGLVNYGAGQAMFYEDDNGIYNLVSMRDVWEIPYLNSQAKERLGYPTQKPLALLDRIIKASSNPGDMVLDPFCGCATALVAANRLGRQWAGIDLSALAIKLVKQRIIEDNSLWAGPVALDAPPRRTDLGDLPNYRTHRHRLYGEQEGVCVGCDTHFPFRVMDVDHILPRSKGGTDHPDNLQLLCSGCNRSKGGKTMAEWKAAQATAL